MPTADLSSAAISVTPIGGPTALLEIGGLRLLTDPTFDEPGEYPIGQRSLVKTQPPAWSVEQVGRVDAVLLSHDQHPDNLDAAGRQFLATVPLVLTTGSAAERLGGTAVALAAWEHTDLARPGGGQLRVTAVPARHGPPGCEPLTGEVTGFVLTGTGLPTVYVSGDNAALELVSAIADRFAPIDVALLFAGGARTALLGDAYLTLSSEMAAEAAAILSGAQVIPVHTDGWAHFSAPGNTLPAAFQRAGLSDALRMTPPGVTVRL